MNTSSSFPYELTIGMIVKNEAQRLRTCLEGLTPLRHAVPCELIITDTGSNDGTQDIAKEFADVYLEFDWCHDFAKARNTATSMAKGRWYVYLDADHTFDESILALADFLQSPESYTPIQAATLSIRNYTNPEGTQFLDSTSCLLHNFSKGRKEFVYPVHECIQFYGDAPLLPVLIHHWGYLIEGEKQSRNEPILEKAIAQDPLNFHHHHHLIRDTKDLTVRKQQLDHAFSCAKKSNQAETDPFYWTICLSACGWAWESKDPSAFALAKQRLLPTQENTFLHLELLGMELSLCLDQEDSSSLVSLCSEYRRVFHHLQDCASLPFRSSFRYQFTQERHFYLLEARVIKYFLKNKDKSSARSLLTHSTMLSQTKEDHSHPYLGDYTNFTLEAGGFSLLRRFHETLVLSPNQEEHNAYLLYLEKQFATLSTEEKQDFLTQFSAQSTTSYTALWALRQVGYQCSKCPSLSLKFLETAPDLYTNPLYRDVFYSSFRSGDDRFSFLEHSSLEHLLAQSKSLCALDPQFHKLIFQALDGFAQTHTPRLCRIWGYLGLLALEEASKQAKPASSLERYYKKSILLLTSALTALYQPHILADIVQGQPSILPPKETFSLLASASLSAQDPTLSSALLARGLSFDPSMKQVLSLW